MAEITLHSDSKTLGQIEAEAGQLYIVFADAAGNLHGQPVGVAAPGFTRPYPRAE
ncbi:hypothetical protein QE375_000954 [Microbacterium foliorum]|uniref:Uncharacterized protein n=1 Tax=Microbacterium foliorum TaxID=104336 RepID=A0ABU1HMX4_9MICO|nr:hypothetical protein [Microbacterium foliorum]MDR6141400.1 hypothetical protein [Microbacterium foliorum]